LIAGRWSFETKKGRAISDPAFPVVFRKNINLAFAVVSFACILAIFSNATKSDDAIKAANVLAVFLPILIGSSTGEDIVLNLKYMKEKGWVIYILLFFNMIAIALFSCYRGIYLFFCAISKQTGELFLKTSLRAIVTMPVVVQSGFAIEILTRKYSYKGLPERTFLRQHQQVTFCQRANIICWVTLR